MTVLALVSSSYLVSFSPELFRSCGWQSQPSGSQKRRKEGRFCYSDEQPKLETKPRPEIKYRLFALGSTQCQT